MDAPERTRLADVHALPTPAPREGTVLVDSRGRALRVSWHHEEDLVVLSVWHGERCTASFRLDADDVPALVDALVHGLAQARGPGVGERDTG